LLKFQWQNFIVPNIIINFIQINGFVKPHKNPLSLYICAWRHQTTSSSGHLRSSMSMMLTLMTTTWRGKWCGHVQTIAVIFVRFLFSFASDILFPADDNCWISVHLQSASYFLALLGVWNCLLSQLILLLFLRSVSRVNEKFNVLPDAEEVISGTNLFLGPFVLCVKKTKLETVIYTAVKPRKPRKLNFI